MTPADDAGSVVFHATRPGAFIDLAAAARRAGIIGPVVDGDLPSAAHPGRPMGINGLAELTVRNDTLGRLITDGHHPR